MILSPRGDWLSPPASNTAVGRHPLCQIGINNMAEKMVFLNCPVCKCGIDVADNGWLQICCPNCKIDIAREDWVGRDVLESKYLARLEAAQQKMHPTKNWRGASDSESSSAVFGG